MSGLSQGYINQLESGKRKFTQKTLCAIAEALDLPLYVFFKEDVEERRAEKPIVKGKEEVHAKRPAAREVLKVLKALPPHIANHYFTLMLIEKDIFKKKRV